MVKPNQIYEAVSSSKFAVVFFDGVCNLCNHSVDFIISHDVNRQFRFASLQEEWVEPFLGEYFPNTVIVDSIVLFYKDGLYQQSDAILRIFKHMGLPWRLCTIFLLIPSFIRNPIYNYLAKNRYRWFGKQDTCRIPSADEKKLFLS